MLASEHRGLHVGDRQPRVTGHNVYPRIREVQSAENLFFGEENRLLISFSRPSAGGRSRRQRLVLDPHKLRVGLDVNTKTVHARFNCSAIEAKLINPLSHANSEMDPDTVLKTITVDPFSPNP